MEIVFEFIHQKQSAFKVASDKLFSPVSCSAGFGAGVKSFEDSKFLAGKKRRGDLK